MNLRITRSIMTTAIVALTVVAWSTVASAQSCPTSPNYTPDFTSNEAA